MFLLKHFMKATPLCGLALLLLPAPSPFLVPVQRVDAQGFPGRLRRPPLQPGEASPPPAAQAPAPQPSAPAPQPAAAALPAPSAALPPSILQQPAHPATIHFEAQSLFVRADNSSLGDILHQLSRQTGMDVQGFGGHDDERVFGSFGPGKPQDVITDLLNGTPYNVLMVGALSDGAPRQLILSAASLAPAAAVAPSAPPPPANDESDDTPPPPPAADPAQNRSPGGPPPSPAIVPGTKSPQELLRELQQMRQQQQPPQQ